MQRERLPQPAHVYSRCGARKGDLRPLPPCMPAGSRQSGYIITIPRGYICCGSTCATAVLVQPRGHSRPCTCLAAQLKQYSSAAVACIEWYTCNSMPPWLAQFQQQHNSTCTAAVQVQLPCGFRPMACLVPQLHQAGGHIQPSPDGRLLASLAILVHCHLAEQHLLVR